MRLLITFSLLTIIAITGCNDKEELYDEELGCYHLSNSVTCDALNEKPELIELPVYIHRSGSHVHTAVRLLIRDRLFGVQPFTTAVDEEILDSEKVYELPEGSYVAYGIVNNDTIYEENFKLQIEEEDYCEGTCYTVNNASLVIDF